MNTPPPPCPTPEPSLLGARPHRVRGVIGLFPSHHLLVEAGLTVDCYFEVFRIKAKKMAMMTMTSITFSDCTDPRLSQGYPAHELELQTCTRK